MNIITLLLISISGLLLKKKEQGLKILLLGMYYSMYQILIFNEGNLEYQNRERYWTISIGYEGISNSLLLWSSIIIIIAYMLEKSEQWKSIILLWIGMIIVLSGIDILIFYIGFELLLIPILILILKGGLKYKRIESLYRIGLYTLLGSLILLMGLLYLYKEFGSLEHELIRYEKKSNWIYLSFLIPFLIKIPIFPFYGWLPEAHSESPTSGSVILAGLILKVGTFGIIRYSLDLFKNNDFILYIYILAIISMIYGSISCIREIDLKKIIAYSSIVHVNISILGLYSKNIEGISGCLYIMISHGIISSGLFILIGNIYDRYKTRNIFYYRGLYSLMPLWSFFFILFILGNLGFPFTSSFIGELLLLIGISQMNLFIGLITGLGMLLSTGYCLWLWNRILYGNLSPFLSKFKDLIFSEFLLLSLLSFFMLLFGFYPTLLLNFFESSCYLLTF